MKRKAALITVMILLVMLAGCGAKKDQGAASDQKTGGNAADTAEYADAYLKKIVEYYKDGTADSFALIDVNGDDIPELAAAASDGPYDDEGNTFLYTVDDGNLNKLLAVTEGLDGQHMFISKGNNTVLCTSGMSGTENYVIYTLGDGEMEKSRELCARFDVENDLYTYFDGDNEITEEQFADEFNKAVSVSNPYTEIDCEGMNEVKIQYKDGYVDYETTSTQKYMSYDKMEKELISLGAQK